MTFSVTIATGPTSLLTEEARSDYEELLALLVQDGIDGQITDRLPSGAGVTWIEVTEIWLSGAGSTAAAWALEKVLDGVSGRAMEWVKRKRKKRLAERPDKEPRPQIIIVKSLTGEPERKIEVDTEGNVTQYRWAKIEDGNNERDD